MKRVIIILSLLLTSPVVFGQNIDIDNLITKRNYTCDEIIYHLTFIIPEYYEKGKIDSIDLFLNYLDQICDSTEIPQCIKILLAIENGSFYKDLYNKTVINGLLSYKTKVCEMAEGINLYANDKKLIGFSKILAKRLFYE
jgi:hypothetical protein